MSNMNTLLSSSDKDSKMEIVLKREEQFNADSEIDLMNVFSYMKKKRRVYIWMILFVMFIGVTVSLFIAVNTKEETLFSAVLSYNYSGAEDLKAPDGTYLDTGIIKSSYIVQTALNNCKLNKRPTVNSVVNNISVKRMISEETKQQLEILEKINEGTVNTGDPSKYIDAINGIEYIYKPQYIINLKNGFSIGENELLFLSDDEMKELLTSIVNSYRIYFFDTYSSFKLPDNRIEDISLDNLDYIEWLDNINEVISSLVQYCETNENGLNTSYRSVQDGLTLADIGHMLIILKNVKVDYIYSFVYFDSLVKNKDLMLTKYDYKLRELQRALDVVNENIKTNEAIINEYKNNNILINSLGQKNEEGNSNMLTASTVSDYFNSLILKQAQNYSQKAYYEKNIADIKDKIDGIKNKYTSKAKLAELDAEIEKVNVAVQELYDIVKSHAEEILGSDSYANSFMTYIDGQGRSEGLFSGKNVKNMAMAVGIALALTLSIWFFDGLKSELKNSKKDESF